MKINFNYLSITVIICSMFFCNSAFAQRGVKSEYASPLMPSLKATPIYIGPALGLNILGHTMDIPTFSEDNLCPNFKNATGFGFFGGLTMEYLFGDVATSNSSIIARVLFNMFPGSVTVDDKAYPVSAPNGTTTMTNVENVLDIDYNALTFEVMYKINPIPGFGLGIVVGPSFDYLITKNMAHRFNLLTPENAQFSTKPDYATFENNNRTIVFSDAEIPNASAIRFGLKAGIQYEILLGSKMYIVPSFAYNFGITTVTSDYTWRVSPLQAGIEARFAF